MTKQAFLTELHLQYRHLPGYIWNVIDKLPMTSVIAIADGIGGSILLGQLKGTLFADGEYGVVYQRLQEERLRQ